MKNYYEILGVSETATQTEIKKAYRKLALQFHPDKNHETGSEDKFKEIAEAYDNLSSKSKRDAYNTSRKSQSTRQSGFSYGTGFDSYKDFTSSFGKTSQYDYNQLIVTIYKTASIKELMEGVTFNLDYNITKTLSTNSSTEQRSIQISVNLSKQPYAIIFENGAYKLVLKIRGGGSSQEINDYDMMARPRKSIATGDLVVKINIDMLGLTVIDSDLIQEVNIPLVDILFNSELILESKLGKKFKIKSFNGDSLSDIRIILPNAGLISGFGNIGNYVFKLSVIKPNLTNVSEEKLQSLKDLLISINK